VNLLQHWHCFLLDFAEKEGILAADQEIQDLFAAVYDKIIDLKTNKQVSKEGIYVYVDDTPYWNDLGRGRSLV